MLKVFVRIEGRFSSLLKYIAITTVLCIYTLPFISYAEPVEIAYVPLEIKNCSTIQKNADRYAGLPQISDTNISSLEGKVINGVAEFVVTRAKAEAALYFQTKLKAELCGDNRKYVPNLCVALDSLELSMSVNSMGEFLRSAVKKDIENIPDAAFEDAASSRTSDDSIKQVLTASRLLFPIYNAAREGRKPLDILRGISETKLICKDELCNSELVKYINLASILLRAYEENAYCRIDSTEEIIIQEFDSSKIYENVMRLSADINIDERQKRLPAAFNSISSTDQLAKIEDDLRQIRIHLVKIDNLIKTMKEPVTLANGTKDYDPKLRLTERLSAIDEMLNLMELLVKDGAKMIGKSNTDVTDLTKQLGEIRKTVRVAKELLKGDEAAYMTAFLIYVSHENDKGLKVPDSVKKIIPVMVEIANAETSKDVAAVIEAAAAPVGSYREKSKRSMMSVTGFVGIAGLGKEYYKVENESKSEEIKIQPFAPLGIHATIPGKCLSGYTGLFFSLVDLGPLVSIHNDSGVESQPNTGFKQIFSPGIYLTHQIHFLGPVNIGYGISQTPELIRTKSGEDVTSWRHQAFVALDLTLFPF